MSGRRLYRRFRDPPLPQFLDINKNVVFYSIIFQSNDDDVFFGFVYYSSGAFDISFSSAGATDFDCREKIHLIVGLFINFRLTSRFDSANDDVVFNVLGLRVK